MNEPEISVIVPIYQVEDYIAECVESLKAQTFADFEVVCVDDGSPDDSVAIARRTAAGDARFRFVSQENAGLSAARNRGIAEARGRYLLFLDSDDAYVPEALELLHLAAEADGLDYLDFTAHPVYESPQARRANNEDFFEQRDDIPGVFSGPGLFVEYQRRDQYFCPACFHFFARSLLEGADLRFEEGIIHEDELFSPLLIAHARRAAYLNVPLYLRRVRADSIMTSSRGIRNVDGVLRVTRVLEDWLRGQVGVRACEDDFAAAMAARIATLRGFIAADAAQAPEADLAAYEAGLAGEALVDFELYVRGGLAIREQVNTRIGQAYLAARRALRW